jgi:hypothetical protein
MDDDWGTEPPIAAGKVRLRDVLKPRKTVIDYTYDFGCLCSLADVTRRRNFFGTDHARRHNSQ